MNDPLFERLKLYSGAWLEGLVLSVNPREAIRFPSVIELHRLAKSLAVLPPTSVLNNQLSSC
jgi:hypothetical protein